MKSCIACVVVVMLLLFAKSTLGQVKSNECNPGDLNEKRYDVLKGKLFYNIFLSNKRNKKKEKLYTVQINFEDFGKVQNIFFMNSDTVKKYLVFGDSSNFKKGTTFYLNYFIPNICSIFYKNIQLDKKITETHKGKTYFNYLVYSFQTELGQISSGSVKYYKGIPVKITGWDYNIKSKVVWELEKLLEE